MEKQLSIEQAKDQGQNTFSKSALNLQDLIDKLPVLLAALDAKNRLLFANKPFINWFCKQSDFPVYGKELSEILGKTVFSAFQPYLEAVLTGSKQSLELTILDQEQNPHHATISLIPYTFENGCCTVYLLIVQDITRLKEIEISRKLQSAALETAANGIVITDRHGRIVWANPSISKMTYYTHDELIGQNPRIFKSGKHGEAYYQSIWEAITAGKTWQGEVINRRKDGSLYVEEMTITPVYNGSHNEITHYIAVKQDVTRRKQAEEALQESENRYRDLVENQGEGAVIMDKEMRFEYVNLAAENILGVPAKKLIGMKLLDFLTSRQKKVLENQLKTRKTGKTSTYELTLRRTDGKKRTVLITATPRFDTAGEYSGSFGIFRDITERKQIETKLRYQNAHDILTNLFNRSYFEEEMQRLEKSRITPISMIVVDVDDLKTVNDTLGHLSGDELIKNVAQLLKESFRTEDMIARIGGDEFAILLPQTNPQELQKSIRRLKSNLQLANKANTNFALSISIGGATSRPGQPLIEVFKLADEQMYADKKTHKSSAL